METLSLALLISVSFLCAIMGTMVGMAMTVMLPVMIFLGMPVHTAVATGRFSMVGISVGNLGKFSRNQKLEINYILPFAISGVFGAVAGAFFMAGLDEKLLTKLIGGFMILICLLVLLEDFLKLKLKDRKIGYKHHFLSIIVGFIIGAYIGTIGGGAATIIIFMLVLLYGLSFHAAVANQKAITLPISIVATIIFMYQGLIDYKIGLLLFITNIIGGWVGAHLILKFKPFWLKAIIVPIAIAFAVMLIFF